MNLKSISFVLPMITLVALIYLVPQTVWADVVPINLPDCDVTNPEVKFIQTDADWLSINDPDYRIFCVYPGDYTSRGSIYITADGTPGNERWIRLYDPLSPNDTTTHPVDEDDSGRAIVQRFEFGATGDPANDWVVDRITKRGGAIVVWKGSERVVLNRMLMEQGGANLIAILNAKNTTLQNSVLRQTEVVPNTDRHCIVVTGDHQGTQIVNNEVYDCAGDALQFGATANGGALVSNNDFYVTPAMYSDCQGNLDPNGLCACAEDGIDMKAPGGRSFPLSDQEWIRIEQNRMWGFRPADTACGGTGSPGQSIGIGSGADNHLNFVLVKDNILMDAPTGVSVGVATVDHISIIGNVIYDMTKQRTDNSYMGAINNLSGDAIEIYQNTIVKADYWLRIGPEADQNDIRCNVAIDGNDRPFIGAVYDDASVVDYNFFYNTNEYTTEGDQSHDLIFATAAESLQDEYCFDRRQWTGQEQVCIPYGLATINSPHNNACDSALGQINGIGVDDYQPPTPAQCTYTYSSWNTCQADSTQTRTVTASTPSDCTGTPVTTQSCTYSDGGGGSSSGSSGDTSSTDSSGGSSSSGGGSSSTSEVSNGNSGGDDTTEDTLRAELLARIAELQQLIATLTAQLNAQKATNSYQFHNKLKVGDENLDVLNLQKKLNSLGFTVAPSGAGAPGNETTYYGPRTTVALKLFQCQYNIVCSGTPETTGFGNFGPMTRAKMNGV